MPFKWAAANQPTSIRVGGGRGSGVGQGPESRISRGPAEERVRQRNFNAFGGSKRLTVNCGGRDVVRPHLDTTSSTNCKTKILSAAKKKSHRACSEVSGSGIPCVSKEVV